MKFLLLQTLSCFHIICFILLAVRFKVKNEILEAGTRVPLKSHLFFFHIHKKRAVSSVDSRDSPLNVISN